MSFARIAPVLFVLLWATGFIGARYAMPWAEPFTFLALRFGAAGVVLAVMAVLFGAARASARIALMAMVAGALLHGIYLGGVFWAVRHGMSAGMSALIAGLQPLMTALLAGLLLGDRVAPRQWLGLAIGFAGVVLVIWPKLGGTSVDALSPATLTAAALALCGISAGTIWQKRYLTGVDLVTGTAWQYAGATLLMAAGSFALETRQIVWNAESVFAMLWAVFVLSIGTILLLMYLIRLGSVARVASLFYLVPATTALMAWPLFGETLTPLQFGGMALATAGVALATSRRDA